MTLSQKLKATATLHKPGSRIDSVYTSQNVACLLFKPIYRFLVSRPGNKAAYFPVTLLQGILSCLVAGLVMRVGLAASPETN